MDGSQAVSGDSASFDIQLRPLVSDGWWAFDENRKHLALSHRFVDRLRRGAGNMQETRPENRLRHRCPPRGIAVGCGIHRAGVKLPPEQSKDLRSGA